MSIKISGTPPRLNPIPAEVLENQDGSKQRFSLVQEKAVIQAVCLRTQAVSIKARF